MPNPMYDILQRLPLEPGTYALILFCQEGRNIRVGQLGVMRLQSGFYVYVGSALGPGGLRGRIAHHIRQAKRPRWHIDYLRTHARVDQVWYCCDALRREHRWAHALETAQGGSIPLYGFGASDCNCASHLYFFDSCPSRRKFERWLRSCNREKRLVSGIPPRPRQLMRLRDCLKSI